MISGPSRERLFLQPEVKVHIHVWCCAVILTRLHLNYEHSTLSACMWMTACESNHKAKHCQLFHLYVGNKLGITIY